MWKWLCIYLSSNYTVTKLFNRHSLTPQLIFLTFNLKCLFEILFFFFLTWHKVCDLSFLQVLVTSNHTDRKSSSTALQWGHKLLDGFSCCCGLTPTTVVKFILKYIKKERENRSIGQQTLPVKVSVFCGITSVKVWHKHIATFHSCISTCFKRKCAYQNYTHTRATFTINTFTRNPTGKNHNFSERENINLNHRIKEHW